MSQDRTTYTVRGGTTVENDPSGYPAGIRYYDTLSDIALAVKRNNNDPRSLNVIMLEIARDNNLPGPRPGVDCNERNITDVRIRAGQNLTLRTSQPIDFEVNYACPPNTPRRPVEPVEELQEVPPEQPVQQVAPAAPLAQFVPAMGGAVDLGVNFQRYNYFYGEPPRDAAARGRDNPDRLRDGALRPGEMEGRSLNLRNRDDRTGAMDSGNAGRLYFGRAQRDELTYRPQANYITDPVTGQFIPNPRFNQKLEQNVGSTVDGDGQLIEVVQGNALISLPRRNNPYHGGIFTDHDTATNLVNQWNSTGEAVGVLTFFRGLHEGYTPIADRFLNGTEAPTAADAQRLLDINVRMAMSPIVWSVSSRGVPVGDVNAIRGAMQQVLESPRFAALAPEEQAALRERYTPLMGQLGNPDQLQASLGGRAGVAQLYNPLTDLAVERASVEHIRDRYYDGLGGTDRDRPRGSDRGEIRQGLTREVGLRYATDLEAIGQRPPSVTELEVGTGVAFNRGRQTDAAIDAARIEALGNIRNNPQLLDDVITHVVTTPGALQNWTDPVFNATRRGASDNRRTLGFTSDRDADRYARATAVALAGSQYEQSLEYQGRNVLQIAGTIPAQLFGRETPGGNRNQNRGIADGFPEAVRERWVNGTDADREQIRATFAGMIDRSVQAQQAGLGYAAASQLTSLDPRLAEYRNGNQSSEVYNRITGAIGTLPRDAMIQRGNATDFIGAQVEMGTEGRVMAGQDIRQVDEAAAAAAIRNGQPLQVDGAQVAGAAVIGGTVLNMDAARAALEAASPSARSQVLMDANSGDRIGQGQTDRQVVTTAANTNPTMFSMLALQTLTSGNLAEGSQRNLRAYIGAVDDGSRDASTYADMLTRHARAYTRAGSDAGARAAAEQAAFADLNGFFAEQGQRPGARTWAANRLATEISGDGPVAAAFTGQMQALAGETRASLTPEQIAQLQARLAVVTTPEQGEQAINAFAAELANANGANAGNNGANAGSVNAAPAAGTLNAETLAAINAGGQLTGEQLSVINAAASQAGVHAPGLNAGIINAVNSGAALTPAQLASIPAGTLSNDVLAALTAGAPLSTDQLNAVNAAARGTPSSLNVGGINADILAALNSGTPLNADQLAALNAAQSSLNAGSPNAGGLNAGSPNAGSLTADQVARLSELAGRGLQGDDLNAGINSILSANGNSLNSLNAGDRDQFLSLFAGGSDQSTLAGRAAEFFAGQSAGGQALEARGGVSWRLWVAVIATTLLPPGTPENPPIPELPGFPGCPGCPRPVPGLPGIGF